jgi:hypothetical protein
MIQHCRGRVEFCLVDPRMTKIKNIDSVVAAHHAVSLATYLNRSMSSFRPSPSRAGTNSRNLCGSGAKSESSFPGKGANFGSCRDVVLCFWFEHRQCLEPRLF